MLRFIPAIALFALFALTTQSASADDWLFFRGPNQDGTSKETSWIAKFPASGPKIAWRKTKGP